MKKKIKYYGITCDGNLMTVSLSGNGDMDFCNSYSVTLERSDSSAPWLNTSKAEVDRVFSESVAWYNSSIDTPEFKKQKGASYEIVEVKLKIEKI